jgi:hypothetical protein
MTCNSLDNRHVQNMLCNDEDETHHTAVYVVDNKTYAGRTAANPGNQLVTAQREACMGRPGLGPM